MSSLRTMNMDVADGADALIILTDWQEFAQLDYEEIKRRLKYPILLDGRNLLDPKRMASLGITYLCVGRPAYAAEGQWRERDGKDGLLRGKSGFVESCSTNNFGRRSSLRRPNFC